MRPGKPGESEYARGFESKGFLVEHPRLPVGFGGVAEDRPGLQDIVVGPHRLGPLARGALLLRPLQPVGNRCDNPFGDLVLHGEEIIHIAIVVVFIRRRHPLVA